MTQRNSPDRQHSVLVAGLGYVGLPLAVRAAEVGFEVTGIDVDEQRIKRLGASESYIEDISDDRLRPLVETGRLRARCDYSSVSRFDTCVIAVPTPLRNEVPDLQYVEDAGRSIAPMLRKGATVVLESTTYPGTTEEVLQPILESGSGLRGGEEFHLGYSPERIDPGNPEWRLENTPKVVSGINHESLRAISEFYRRIVTRVVTVSSPRTAELTKLLENTFRQVNIALINELALCSGTLGVDIWEAVDAASTKPFGFMPFFPGPGVGGHCLPVDPAYLSWRVRQKLQHDIRFVSLAQEINDSMPGHVLRRIESGLSRMGKSLSSAQILVIGLAYKKNTGDLRGSPAAIIAELLAQHGAYVLAVEPHIDSQTLPVGVRCVDLTTAEVGAADAIAILTDHDNIDYGLVEQHGQYVFDTRHRCQGDRIEYL
ncbi:nucleotide sugar dehydrogenase [Streptomyces sioyaensis]|uniref:nucleotide sugar dehydrogenase n=1 Tax=Streptomyces sioyaensis TaxID=67364 RepID=UPI0033D300BD